MCSCLTVSTYHFIYLKILVIHLFQTGFRLSALITNIQDSSNAACFKNKKAVD